MSDIENVDLDTDGDGLVDTTIVDYTGDGVGDVVLQDLTGDGVADVVGADLDGDGVIDVVGVDTDGDGLVDTVIDPETGAPPVDPAAYVPSGEPGPAVPGTDPDGDPATHGDPGGDLIWSIQQSENGFCMPDSVAMIVSEFTGQPVSEATAVEAAVGLNLLDGSPGKWEGMTAPEGEVLLEHFGIEARTEQGDLDDLRRYLDEGRGVILGIDSSEVWEGVNDDGTGGDAGADHAVVITGIDDRTGMVTLNDPGHPEGAGAQVPISVLLDAWADSGNTMVVTEGVPASADTPYAAGFVMLPVVLSGRPE